MLVASMIVLRVEYLLYTHLPVSLSLSLRPPSHANENGNWGGCRVTVG